MPIESLETLFDHFQSLVHQLRNEWQSLPRSEDDISGILVRVERMYRHLSTLELMYGRTVQLKQLVETASVLCRTLNELYSQPLNSPKTFIFTEQTGTRGKPKILISKDLLEFYLKNQFSVSEITCMTGISQSTIKRRMSEHGLTVKQFYSDISNHELDEQILRKLNDFPNTGYKKMKGFLLSSGIRVQEIRIRESMRRVDPEGVILRTLQSRTVIRRKYSVAGPLSLWHIDGMHKLIA